MKKTVIILLLTIGLIGINKVSAQMGTAQTITWDVEVETDVKASKGNVWSYLNHVEKLKSLSNGYVKSIKEIDEEIVVSRDIVFSNGKQRSETITQTNVVEKFMVIKFKEKSLPKGVKKGTVGVFTKAIDDENTNIKWFARIEGKKSAKKALLVQLKTEFESYAKGFGNIKG